MTKVIDAELHLESILGLGLVDSHETGIVDQYIEARLVGANYARRRPDGAEAGQVEGHNLDVDRTGGFGTNFVHCILGLGSIAASK